MTLEPLGPRHVLFEAGQQVQGVYFPISGMVSLVTVLSDGSAVEVAVVGREGVVGTVIFLGDCRWGNVRAIVQIRGEALKSACDRLPQHRANAPF
jgi:CRP-like cAMP-binding protein